MTSLPLCIKRRRPILQWWLCIMFTALFCPDSEAFTVLGSPSSACHPRPTHIRPLCRNDVMARESISSTDDRFEDPPTEYLATCIPGLAPILEEELISLGAAFTTVLSNAAVTFTSETRSNEKDDSKQYPIELSALLWLRTAHRILEKIDTFGDIQTRDDVYAAVQHSRLHVKDLLGDGEGGLLSLSVKVIANGRLPKDISHSHYTALTIKNALVDQVRDLKDGERPDVELDDPDVPLVAIFHSQGTSAEMTLYRSLSPPGSLHKRGYRAEGAIHKAAMKESLAAGLLLGAGWMEACRDVRSAYEGSDNSKQESGLTLVDPMCGSGSLLIEAAMIAVDFAPGLMRIMCSVPGQQIPPVLRWKGNKAVLMPVWKEMLLEASQRAKAGLRWMREHKGTIEIIGNDIHFGALELVEASLAKSGGLNRIVDLHQNDCNDWKIPQSEESINNQVWVTTNPPWGVRLSDNDHESWESLRTFLRSNCPPGRTQAWVLSGNKSATKHLGLRRSQSIALKTGQQDLRWIQYIILDKKPREEVRRDFERNRELPDNHTATKNITTDQEGRRIRTRSTADDKSAPSARRPPPRKVSSSRNQDDESWI